MRLPRRGILIRLAIYVPILVFLSWRAGQKWLAERDAEPAAQIGEDRLELELAPHKRTITLPDGSVQTVYEMTEAEAERILGPMPSSPSMSKGEGGSAPAPTSAEPAR